MPVFYEEWTEPFPVDEALDDWISLKTSTLGNLGYQANMQGRTIAYRRRYTPAVAIVCGVLTFPVGILFWLLWKADSVFTVHFEGAGEDTKVTARGDAKPAVIANLLATAAEAERALETEPYKGW